MVKVQDGSPSGTKQRVWRQGAVAQIGLRTNSCRYLINKKLLLYCKNDKETYTILINRAFVRDSAFRPKCAKHTILLHNLDHFLR